MVHTTERVWLILLLATAVGAFATSIFDTTIANLDADAFVRYVHSDHSHKDFLERQLKTRALVMTPWGDQADISDHDVGGESWWSNGESAWPTGTNIQSRLSMS